MGLDVVEWVMAVEARFAVIVPDEAAAAMRTVGDLIAFVSARTAHRPRRCASQQLFHALRRQLPRTVRPDTPLTELRQSRFGWRALCRRAGFARPWFTPLPDTLAGLVTELVEHHRPRFDAEGPHTETEVREAIFAITCAQFAVSTAEVGDATRVADLAPHG